MKNKETLAKNKKQYYEKNRVNILKAKKKYHQENKVRILEYQKQYREENRKKNIEYQKQYRDKNKVELAGKRKIYKQQNKISIKLWYQVNKVKIAEKRKIYDQKNKSKIKQYYQDNKEKFCEQGKQYRQENKEKIWKRNKTRLQTNSDYALKMRLRRRLLHAFKLYSTTGKTKPADEYGIDYAKILKHLEPFPANRNLYHIDHIKPLKLFDFDDPEQIKEAFAPENHQWLLAEDNLSKGAKWEQPIIIKS